MPMNNPDYPNYPDTKQGVRLFLADMSMCGPAALAIDDGSIYMDPQAKGVWAVRECLGMQFVVYLKGTPGSPIPDFEEVEFDTWPPRTETGLAWLF